MAFKRRFFGALALLASGAFGCSLINAPDEITSGSGASGGEGGGPIGGGGSGGAPPACTTNAECADLTTDCGVGECSPEGTCVVAPFAAGTECGPAVGGFCDLQDTCDGAGTCVANHIQDGTFCEDCPAGPGLCALCAQGVCADCTTRATEKSFRSPLAASGWTLTGGWKIRAETPPLQYRGPTDAQGKPAPHCSDGIDNDGDGLVDMNDPGCTSPDDYYEFDAPGTQCSDGVDNDGYSNQGDGFIDLADPDCDGPGDDTEDTKEAIVFEYPVLGTDGNRANPYNAPFSAKQEQSTALSPPTVLPAQLQFRSWHMDEAYQYDLKAVRVSLDGVSFTEVATCPPDLSVPFPFCEPTTRRDPDDWDLVTLPLPNEFHGQVGYVLFLYTTTDDCCQFERGWYVDALNFAQDCACATATECAYLDSGCASGSCAATGECQPSAENVGQTCTNLSVDEGCAAAAACDDNGLCSADYLPFETDSCTSCDDEGFCDVCIAGACKDCPDVQTVNGLNTSAWTFNGDWSFQYNLRANSVTPNETPFFPLAPALGNDGSRTGALPYAGQSEIENATMITGPTTIPPELVFKSWHQDRGGNDPFNLRDKKTIRISVDGGSNWTTVVNCDSNMVIPFCQPWPAFTNRDPAAWDDVTVDVPNQLVGQTGIIEFSYDTVDSGQGWERGWFIDDLNFNRCDLFHPPWPPVD